MMRKQSQMSRAIDELVDKVKRLEVQVEIARLEEREKCARVCENLTGYQGIIADTFAQAIRGRTE
jgi:hypothetical protein